MASGPMEALNEIIDRLVDLPQRLAAVLQPGTAPGQPAPGPTTPPGQPAPGATPSPAPQPSPAGPTGLSKALGGLNGPFVAVMGMVQRFKGILDSFQDARSLFTGKPYAIKQAVGTPAPPSLGTPPPQPPVPSVPAGGKAPLPAPTVSTPVPKVPAPVLPPVSTSPPPTPAGAGPAPPIVTRPRVIQTPSWTGQATASTGGASGETAPATFGRVPSLPPGEERGQTREEFDDLVEAINNLIAVMRERRKEGGGGVAGEEEHKSLQTTMGKGGGAQLTKTLGGGHGGGEKSGSMDLARLLPMVLEAL